MHLYLQLQRQEYWSENRCCLLPGINSDCRMQPRIFANPDSHAMSFASGHPGKNWIFWIDFGFSKLKKEAFVLPDPGHASF